MAWHWRAQWSIGKTAQSPEPKAILLNCLRQREAGGMGLAVALCFDGKQQGEEAEEE